jgi:hypothetical protein
MSKPQQKTQQKGPGIVTGVAALIVIGEQSGRACLSRQRIMVTT